MDLNRDERTTVPLYAISKHPLSLRDPFSLTPLPERNNPSFYNERVRHVCARIARRLQSQIQPDKDLETIDLNYIDRRSSVSTVWDAQKRSAKSKWDDSWKFNEQSRSGTQYCAIRVSLIQALLIKPVIVETVKIVAVRSTMAGKASWSCRVVDFIYDIVILIPYRNIYNEKCTFF